ncbi:hypothetical protein D3C76_1661820 [compost metagenome]
MINGNGMPNPGTSVSIKITAPTIKATIPPKPMTPKLGKKASAIMNARPSKMSPTPA